MNSIMNCKAGLSSVKRVVSLGDGTDNQLSIGHAVRARERSPGMHLREIFGNTASAADFSAVSEEANGQSELGQHHRRTSSVGCSWGGPVQQQTQEPAFGIRTSGFFSGRVPEGSNGPNDTNATSNFDKTQKRKTQLGELLATSIAGNDVTGSCLYSIGPVVGLRRDPQRELL